MSGRTPQHFDFDESVTQGNLRPGVVLRERYRIEREIGRGGMGVVYKAHDTLANTTVALKFPPRELLGDATLEKLVLREAKLLMTLTHPGIVRLFTVEQDAGTLFLVEEFVNGFTLDEYLSRREKLTAQEVRRLLKEIAPALAAAHDHGVVHRDLKPSNIMLSFAALGAEKDGLSAESRAALLQTPLDNMPPFTVKVMNFGIAEVVQTRTTQLTGKTTTGTLIYMSPEQVTGRKADARSDIYSLGSVLYELLTGEPPFTRGDVTWQILNRAPDAPECDDAALVELILRALHKDPNERWQSVTEMAGGKARAGARTAKGTGAAEPPDVPPQPYMAAGTPPLRPQPAVSQDAPPRAQPPVAVKRGSGGAKAAWTILVLLVIGGGIAGIVAYDDYERRMRALAWERDQAQRAAEDARRKADAAAAASRAQPQQESVAALLTQFNQKLLASPPQAGQGFALDLGGNVAMEFVWIPAGSFMMGSPDSEEDRKSDEGPQHRVTISRGFWMGKYEVTQAQWRRIMSDDPDPSHFKGDNLPVELVTWHDCVEFCARLTQRERQAGRLPAGYAFRLPTEAEWEYACRAGTTTRYYTGDSESDLPRAGWYSGNSGEKTHPVGQKEPNAFGLYDMHGNVLEWCDDWYGPYSGEAQKDPRGPSSGSGRVFRGGWYSGARNCRSANRNGHTPDYAWYDVGFRVSLPSGQ